jgi:tetratricopeptide (TPR) repeat protein
MRDRTYMVVDPRHDHSFRVPRPDLSVTLAVPNACNACHADQSPNWAAARVAEWFPGGRAGTFHYAQGLHAGRSWSADRNALLRRVIEDGTAPAIVRATAIELLASQLDEAAVELVGQQLRDGSPLVQLAALEALGSIPANVRVSLAQRFLSDPSAALRMASARVLLPARDSLTESRQRDLDVALGEFVAAQEFNADRAEGLLNIGNLQAELGRFADAEATYRRAIEEHPEFAPAYVNSADLYRRSGREAEAEALLRDGIARDSRDPSLRHALGLSLVRSGRVDEALTSLREASERGAGEPLYAYVYGVALHSTGDVDEALDVLDAAYERYPGYAPLLVALTTMRRDTGNLEGAREHARRLLELSPSDANVRALAAELGVELP